MYLGKKVDHIIYGRIYINYKHKVQHEVGKIVNFEILSKIEGEIFLFPQTQIPKQIKLNYEYR